MVSKKSVKYNPSFAKPSSNGRSKVSGNNLSGSRLNVTSGIAAIETKAFRLVVGSMWRSIEAVVCGGVSRR